MRSLGLDFQDSGEWRAALWDEDRAVDLRSYAQVAPLWDLIEDVLGANPATPMVLPSGFGVPVMRARDLLDQDISEMTILSGGEPGRTLAEFLDEARRRAPRAFCIPSVKLLPSIPLHRKLGRVDLGAAEALCAAVWTIHWLQHSGQAPAGSDFLLLHVAADARTILAVRAGRIVDGIGGTAGGLGATAAAGRQRLLTSLGPAAKWRRGTGGEAEALAPGSGLRAHWEAVEKEALAFLGCHRLPAVVITGDRRFEASSALEGRLPGALTLASGDGYEAALGAAVIAGGLTGGPTAPLVDHLGIREARERIFDWLTP